MRNIFLWFLFTLIGIGCTSKRQLSYLNNLPELDGEENFTMKIPDYRIQQRDILYITAKAINPEGIIVDFLTDVRTTMNTALPQSEAGQFLYGYIVGKEGSISIPSIGKVTVASLTLEEAREEIQLKVNEVFMNATVECKLLGYKFTIIGEVKSAGTYVNYSNYLTILEAIGRAGGINEFGRRDKILVVRPIENGTKTFTVNLQDKSIISNEAFFILPNDIIIVEPESRKVFNLNLPTYSFILTTVSAAITSTLLLINYFK